MVSTDYKIVTVIQQIEPESLLSQKMPSNYRKTYHADTALLVLELLLPPKVRLLLYGGTIGGGHLHRARFVTE